MAIRLYDAPAWGNIPNMGVNGYIFNWAISPVQGQYYLGSFFIDTGYNDPVSWNTSLDITELYTARAYVTLSQIYPNPGANVYIGVYGIRCTPTWSTTHYVTPAANTPTSRVYLKCEVWINNPIGNNGSSDYQFRVDQVQWGLYRI